MLDYSSDIIDVECHDTPSYESDGKNRIDIAGCAQLLRDLKTSGIRHVFIEKVNAGVWAGKKTKDGKQMSMGVTSAFSFGQGYGVWLGILSALEIPHTLVTPQAWKKSMMPGEPKDKDASRVVCKRLFPVQVDEWLSRKKDHGRADSILLAEYGRRMLDSSSGILEE